MILTCTVNHFNLKMLEFSAILGAVKPRMRSDQYVILSALFYLGASAQPVTAKQISDLLELHLRRKIPTNISASLRSYSHYVERSGRESPMKWRLTVKGIDRLRMLSGLELTTLSAECEYQTDVAFVTALEHPEFTALTDATGGSTKWQQIGEVRFSHLYRATHIKTTGDRSLSVVGTVATSMGLTAAAIATTQLILQFRPRIVVMVGIAAGTRSGNKEFGDILVADPSVDYNSGKVVFEGGIREFLPDPYPIGLNARLRSVIQKYRAPNELFSEIRQRWNGKLPQRDNRLHLGPVGASDQVIDDESRVIEIQKNWRKLIGVEMEAYGVYRACHEAPEPKPRFVSFKSVCDFAAHKSDSWQEYASFTSAHFAVEFLKKEWDSIWPPQQL
jgi:nucleoside phosphorylase